MVVFLCAEIADAHALKPLEVQGQSKTKVATSNGRCRNHPNACTCGKLNVRLLTTDLNRNKSSISNLTSFGWCFKQCT